MGYKMRFYLLSGAVHCAALADCAGDGGPVPNSCDNEDCGSGDSCMQEACCNGGGVEGRDGTRGCKHQIYQCGGRRDLLTKMRAISTPWMTLSLRRLVMVA